MKQLKSILIAFCAIALLSQVAYAHSGDKVPKTHYAVSIEKSDVTNLEISASGSFVGYFATVDQHENVGVVVLFHLVGPDNLSKNILIGETSHFSVAMLPDRICSRSGSISYIEIKKTCYKSPIVDSKWVWQYSVQYNC